MSRSFLLSTWEHISLPLIFSPLQMSIFRCPWSRLIVITLFNSPPPLGSASNPSNHNLLICFHFHLRTLTMANLKFKHSYFKSVISLPTPAIDCISRFHTGFIRWFHYFSSWRRRKEQILSRSANFRPSRQKRFQTEPEPTSVTQRDFLSTSRTTVP